MTILLVIIILNAYEHEKNKIIKTEGKLMKYLNNKYFYTAVLAAILIFDLKIYQSVESIYFKTALMGLSGILVHAGLFTISCFGKIKYGIINFMGLLVFVIPLLAISPLFSYQVPDSFIIRTIIIILGYTLTTWGSIKTQNKKPLIREVREKE